MKSQHPRGPRGRGRGPRRNQRAGGPAPAQAPAAPPSLWQKIVGFFKRGPKNGSHPVPKVVTSRQYPGAPAVARAKPALLEVTSEKLYVGNLSYEATENDLEELFNGVGAVRQAEIVADRQNDRSKGFGFVTMATVDEARRAVTELHDKPFMGRKLVVSGARTGERESNYRG